MQKRFTTKLIAVTVTGLAFGAGPAMALETPKSAGVATPSVAVPVVSTPALTTPGESATANVGAIELPTGASIDLNGAADQSVTTPEATPGINESAGVPSLNVDSVSAGGESVDSQYANVDMPASASTSQSDAQMKTADDGTGAYAGWTDSSYEADASAADHDASAGADIS
jgi:hypothetical protein